MGRPSALTQTDSNHGEPTPGGTLARSGQRRCARWNGAEGACRVPRGEASQADDERVPDEMHRQVSHDDGQWVDVHGARPCVLVVSGSMSSARKSAGCSPVLTTMVRTPAWGAIKGLVVPVKSVSV